MTAIDRVKQAQGIFGLIGDDVDGDPGPKTETAWEALKAEAKAEWHEWEWEEGTASSFADPADIVAFKKCKATGKTDKQCFAVGDNGIGQFGAITAQEHTPMCALHSTDMIERWGSVIKSAHKTVVVEANGRSVTCALEDRMSARGRIDLNPAASKALGLKPPFLTSARWRWA